jgi:exopolysaccharide biosynthesis polyprenyl glycosylphosphotransferase
MTPSNRKTILELVQFGDIGLLFFCLGTTYVLSSHQHTFALFNSLETRHPVQVFIETIMLGIGWHTTLRAHRFYQSRRLEGFVKETLEICSASFLCSLVGLAWLWSITSASSRSVSQLLLICPLFTVLTFASIMLTRASGRGIMHLFRVRGRNLRHILIVGTNRRAHAFVQDLALHPEWGYNLQGFVDDQWWCQETSASNAGPLLGRFDEFPALLRKLPVDEVILTLRLASFHDEVEKIVVLCRKHGIAVRSVGTFFDQEASQRTNFLRGAVGSITLHDESWNERASMVKRTVDTVISLTLLVTLSPVMIVVALLIKMTSKGPVLFTQTRLGYGKRPFQILKFRTMVQDAEKLIGTLAHLNQSNGPTFKAKYDPRITPLGRFLRKTSLDELPQLINVLVGDMSLVGPRPLPLRDYQGFSEDWHRRRFSVKPGITCLWQVMGRSSIGFDEWMALDIRYIEQWSVWLDIKILFWTIPAVFRGSGAV